MGLIQKVILDLEAPLLSANLDKLLPDEVSAKIEAIVDECSSLALLDFTAVQRELIGDAPILQADPTNPFRFVVYKNDVFFIEILAWFNDPTVIHSHPFSGLAYVLDGESVDVRFSFNKAGDLGDVIWGQLDPIGIEKIQRGSKFRFSTGRDFIHRVFHLNHRCSTMRIGLRRRHAMNPQWSFFYPGLGMDSALFQNKEEDLRLNLADRLFEFSPGEFRDGIRGLLNKEKSAPVLWYLCAFQARHPNYDVYGELIRDCPKFCDQLKKIIQSTLRRCLGDSFLCGDRFKSPEALLLTGMAELFGFGRETGDYLTQLAGGRSVQQWLLKALTDIALSSQLGAPVGWHLLDRVKRYESGLTSDDSAVRPIGMNHAYCSYYENIWRLSNFEGFLASHVF